MKKKITNSSSNSLKLAIISASLAGLAATTYFFLGPKGKKNQKHARAWAIRMKADVIEKLEMARDVSQSTYNEIIESVAAEYQKGKKASGNEINSLAKDLKKHWKTISRGAQIVKQDAKTNLKKIAKKAQY